MTDRATVCRDERCARLVPIIGDQTELEALRTHRILFHGRVRRP